MRAFIERVFKSKKLKKEQEEIAKEVPYKVEAIIKEVKKEKHIDCECKECIAKVKQNAE